MSVQLIHALSILWTLWDMLRESRRWGIRIQGQTLKILCSLEMPRIQKLLSSIKTLWYLRMLMEVIELCQGMRIEIDLQLIIVAILKLKYLEIYMAMLFSLEVSLKQDLDPEEHGNNRLQCLIHVRIFSHQGAVSISTKTQTLRIKFRSWTKIKPTRKVRLHSLIKFKLQTIFRIHKPKLNNKEFYSKKLSSAFKNSTWSKSNSNNRDWLNSSKPPNCDSSKSKLRPKLKRGPRPQLVFQAGTTWTKL